MAREGHPWRQSDAAADLSGIESSMSDPAIMPAADFLAGLVERASGRARTLMPRLPLPFEPIAGRHSEETMFDLLDPPPAPAREAPAIPLSFSRSNTASTREVRVEI